MRDPLVMPDHFNPETDMFLRLVDGKPYHCIIPAVRFIPTLLANGAPEDVAQAERTIRAVLACQETRPDDPHRGNFLWEREDEVVEDLNAVQFVLFNLIPVMIEHRNLLPASLQSELVAGIRLGLDEIQRLDVGLEYTNIVLKDILNSCLGGELLGDSAIAARGYAKLHDWMRLTDRNGIPTEFNSPPYAEIAVDVLHQLSTLVVDAETRTRARLMLLRLALSIALHIHPPTGRLAGPYSRAYRQHAFAEVPAEIGLVQDWARTGIVPAWFESLVRPRGEPFQLVETPDAEKGVAITTYQAPSFALGVSTQELTTQENRFIALQSNVCIAHYVVAAEGKTGVMLSRYLLDDHWLGDYRTTPSREADQLLPEEGRFFGAQDGPRMIGIYAPRELGAWARHHSAKAMLLWLDRRLIDEVWVGETRVSSLPAHVPPGETVVVASGEVYFAVQPLSCTDLGRDAPVRLVDIDGHLALEMYNYLGPAKTFWELADPGSFYKRQPQCGFYLEIANEADHGHALAFGQTVSASMITDELRPLAERERRPNGLWHVEVGRGPHRLGLEVDLVHWRLMRRWNEGGDLAFPMLESPVARETRTGLVSVGGATLTCGKGAAWLVALPEQKLYVAAIHGEHAAPVELVIPGGRVTIERMHAGLITWQEGRVLIEPASAVQGVRVEGGTLAHTIASA